MLLVYLSFIMQHPLRAPVVQLDRIPGYEPGGWEFESSRARHFFNAHCATLMPINS